MRFTIFSRLMLDYLTVVVLVMALSVYAILKIRQLNRGANYILNIDNRILEDQKKLTDAILSQLRYERKFVITRDATFYKQFLSAKGEKAPEHPGRGEQSLDRSGQFPAGLIQDGSRNDVLLL